MLLISVAPSSQWSTQGKNRVFEADRSARPADRQARPKLSRTASRASGGQREQRKEEEKIVLPSPDMRQHNTTWRALFERCGDTANFARCSHLTLTRPVLALSACLFIAVLFCQNVLLQTIRMAMSDGLDESAQPLVDVLMAMLPVDSHSQVLEADGHHISFAKSHTTEHAYTCALLRFGCSGMDQIETLLIHLLFSLPFSPQTVELAAESRGEDGGQTDPPGGNGGGAVLHEDAAAAEHRIGMAR